MEGLIIILLIVAIILIVKHSKKRKKQTGKKIKLKDLDTFLTEKSRSCSKLNFPAFYFEKMYFSCLTKRSNMSIHEQIDGYRKNVTEHFTNTFCPDYLNFLKRVEELSDNNSIFYSTKEEMNSLLSHLSPKEAEEKISKDIKDSILYVGYARDKVSYFYAYLQMVLMICENNKKLWMGITSDNPPGDEKGKAEYYEALSKAQEGYKFAYNLQWDNICKEHPYLNKEEIYNKFVQITENDSLSWQIWKLFWSETFMQLNNEYGIEKSLSAGQEIINYFNENSSKSWASQIREGFNEYSSIYEISDFNINEMMRIHELYVYKRMTGVYKKSKDPKYNEA